MYSALDRALNISGIPANELRHPGMYHQPSGRPEPARRCRCTTTEWWDGIRWTRYSPKRSWCCWSCKLEWGRTTNSRTGSQRCFFYLWIRNYISRYVCICVVTRYSFVPLNNIERFTCNFIGITFTSQCYTSYRSYLSLRGCGIRNGHLSSRFCTLIILASVVLLLVAMEYNRNKCIATIQKDFFIYYCLAWKFSRQFLLEWLPHHFQILLESDWNPVWHYILSSKSFQ